MRAAAGAAWVREAPALAGLVAAGRYVQKRDNSPVLQGSSGGRPGRDQRERRPRALVQAMLVEDGADDAVVEKRDALFEQAVKVHGVNAQAAGRGEGADRHLLGERTASWKSLPFLGLMACCAAACVVI